MQVMPRDEDTAFADEDGLMETLTLGRAIALVGAVALVLYALGA
ncbi:MAG TPA: hypothetical protein VIA64_12065 [Burkholderiales bacterium]|jgi:hypothetical protein